MLVLLLACAAPALKLEVSPDAQPHVAEAPDWDGEGGRPTGRLQSPAGFGADFVVGEVVLAGVDAAGAAPFAADLDAELVHEAGIAGQEVVVLRLADPASFAAGRLRRDLEALSPDASGRLLVSSDEALGTLAAAARLAADGVPVTLDLLVETDTFLDGSATEANPMNGWDAEAFTWPFLQDGGNSNYGATRAWIAMELSGADHNRVTVGVVDQDIRHGLDFEPVATWLEESSYVDSAKAGHGSFVTSMLASPADDGRGGAGVAHAVADLVLLESDIGLVKGHELAWRAKAEGARVINLSWGVDWPEAFEWVLAAPILWMNETSADTVLVAAAGNDGMDITAHDGAFGAESVFTFPCEVSGVFCVGGEGLDSDSRATRSNYGSTVDLYGPYDVWTSDVAGGEGAAGVAGTSLASPYVAGAAALVMAADPTLSPDAVEALLLDTAQVRPADGLRAVDVDAAVRAALGNVRPWLRVTPEEVALTDCGGANLQALVDDDDAVTLSWTSTLDGYLGSAEVMPTTGLSVGAHLVTVTATDTGGLTSTAAAWVTVENTAPDVSIIPGSTAACGGQALELRAVATDCTHDLDELGYTWFVEGVEAGTGERFTYVADSTRTDDIEVRVTDPEGASDDAQIWVDGMVCESEPPTIEILTPAADTDATDGPVWTGYDEERGLWYVDLEVAATAWDPEDGAISEIYWSTDRWDLQPSQVLEGPSGTVRLYGDTCAGERHVLSATAWDSTEGWATDTRIVVAWTLC